MQARDSQYMPSIPHLNVALKGYLFLVGKKVTLMSIIRMACSLHVK